MVTIALVIAVEYFRLQEALRGDYYTVDVMLMIKDYVETHEGNWPSSWEGLEETDRFRQRGIEMSHYRPYAKVDFSLTSDQLMQQPESISEAVRPVSGKFICYPHAADHLQEILRAIQNKRGQNVQVQSAVDSR